MAIVSCPECGSQISSTAGNCPSCGFDIGMQKELSVESAAAWIVLLPTVAYFGVILGGIHLDLIDTNHAYFYASFLGFNWLYGPILMILGGASALKYVWWGGWSGGILISIGIVYLVKYVAPELAPF